MSKFKTIDYRRVHNQVAGRPGPPVAYIFSGNKVYFERQLREGVNYPWTDDLPPEPENDD